MPQITTKKWLSLQRKRIRQEAAKYGPQFVSIPREKWPKDGPTATRIDVCRNNKFLVQVFQESNDIVRLSIVRTELDNLGRWRDQISWEELQAIKSGCGYAHSDAVEVFPDQYDVMNIANMRHLWVLPNRLEFAWRKDILGDDNPDELQTILDVRDKIDETEPDPASS